MFALTVRCETEPSSTKEKRGMSIQGLRIHLAGDLALQISAAALDARAFAGRQGRLVFAYLATAHDRQVSCDELADLLWPDGPPATWRKAIAVIATKTRSALTSIGLDGKGLLGGTAGCYRLNLPPGTWIDIEAAAAACQSAERLLQSGDPAGAAEAAAHAVGIARHPFLPGEEGRWVDEMRERLGDVLSRGLDAASEALLALGRPRDAMASAAEVTRLEPYRESAYRLLMRAHVAAGDAAAALKDYERCRRLLADELGVDPSAETHHLYLEILKGRRRRRW
ncbi:MAG: AfsR/SARP family transcriptional regulator [Actinomycetota bacterium]